MSATGGSASDYLDGYLKQQCMDQNGLFVWERKLFTLDIPNLNLFVKDTDNGGDVQSALSLRGVKYAKEWSFSSSVSGFGFDLVWFSGKLWSFFAEDERMCKTWVDAINYSISLSIASSGDGKMERTFSTSRPPLPPRLESRSLDGYDSNHSEHGDRSYAHDNTLEETKMEDSSPREHYVSNMPEPRTAEKFSSERSTEGTLGDNRRSASKSYDEYDQQLRDLTSASVRSSTESHEHRSIQQQIDAMNHPQHHTRSSSDGHPAHTSDHRDRAHSSHHHAEAPRHDTEHHHRTGETAHHQESGHGHDAHTHSKHTAEKHTSHASHHRTEDSSVRSAPSTRPPPHSDHHSVHSAHRMSATTGHSNIEQRMLFGNTTPATAHTASRSHDHHDHPPAPPAHTNTTPATVHSVSRSHSHDHHDHPPAHSSHSHTHHSLPSQHSTAAPVQELHTFPSAAADARLASEKELITHSMSLDRPSSHIFAQEVATLQANCQLLEMQLARKQTELDGSKHRHEQLQRKYDESTSEFEQRLDLARDKERQLITESKREMENKLLRASNDNMSFFDAANKTLKLQHERELACLREELSEERKRHSSLLDRSQTLRERAERAEHESQQELATLRDKFSTLQVEATRMKKESELDRMTFDKEQKHLLQESQRTITALQEEKERILVQTSHDLRDRMAEMNDRMQKSLQNIRDSEMETMRQEMEGQRIRSLAELHKKCQHEIELVRTEERKLAAIEMENIRSAFLSREHQTAEDLIQLEKLHSTRVSQLEQTVAALKAEKKALSDKLHVVSQEAQHGSAQVQRGASEMQARMEEYAARAEGLHSDLLEAHREIQEGKVREASYRDQLSRALTQSRLQHAELLEAKQQASSGSAQAFQWRNATRESDLSIAAAETSLRISRDEVAMLEHQLRRVEEENAELKSELQRSDRLVYGTKMNHTVNNVGFAERENTNMLNTTTASLLSTKHLLRSNLTSPYPSKVNPDLLAPTMSSSARTAVPDSYALPTKGGKSRKLGTSKR